MSTKRLLYIIFILLVSCSYKKQSPLVQEGIADISGLSFEEERTRLLDGEWGVVWGELITDINEQTLENAVYVDFKSKWKDIPKSNSSSGMGYASYFLKLKKNDDQDLAIKMPLINTATQLIIDGETYFEAGEVGKSAATSQPTYKSGIIRLPQTSNKYYEIIIQVSNFHYRSGGSNSYAEIGDHSYIKKRSEIITYVTFLLAGAFIFTALYLIALYVLRRQETPMLYIGLFFIVLTHRMVSVGDMLIAKMVDLGWEFYLKSDYLTFYLGAITFILFIRKFFNGQIKLPYERIVVGVLIVASMIVLIFPARIYSHISIPMQFFVMLVTIVLFYLISKLAAKGNFTARLLLITILALFIAIVNDVLYYNRIIDTGLISHYGMIVLAISLPFIIPVYFSRLFDQVEVLSKKLTKQNKELKKLNEDLDVFVYNVSHDLKAPLASIQGLINIIKKEENIDRIKEVTAYQEKSVNKLNTFIKDLLNYSRNTRMGVSIEAINFQDMLNETIEEIKYIDEYKRINNEITVSGSAPFENDKSRLRIVLNNLISNAFKYHDPDKDDPFVKIHAVVDTKSATLTIADNGIGIPEGQQQKVFDMFYRAHEGVSEGTGLGLYLVKECIVNLGGEIKLSSEENKGTTVIVKIPNKSKT